jgi:acetolactate synthase I/II/III large subunit
VKPRSSQGRRNFLKGVAASAAAAVSAQQTPAQTQSAQESRSGTAPVLAKEIDPPPPSNADVLTADGPGSDFMVDVLKSLGFEYLIANPGSSFRGLHESIVNYGGNKNPEFITCCHEESSVAMAHGYAKVEGKPALVMAHGTVGLQHASMAIYNAFCDRVPMFLVLGNSLNAPSRRPGVEWDHSVQDAASMVRDFTKWDDCPMSLAHFTESAARAYKITMTPPMMPVLLVADGDLQETPVSPETKLRISKTVIPAPPQGDSSAVAEAARLLVAAENPVLVADRLARTPSGMKLLVDLAETLQAAVVDQRGRMNFPPGPASSEFMLERLRLTDTCKRIALRFPDDADQPKGLSAIPRHPPRKIFECCRVKFQASQRPPRMGFHPGVASQPVNGSASFQT